MLNLVNAMMSEVGTQRGNFRVLICSVRRKCVVRLGAIHGEGLFVF